MHCIWPRRIASGEWDRGDCQRERKNIRRWSTRRTATGACTPPAEPAALSLGKPGGFGAACGAVTLVLESARAKEARQGEGPWSRAWVSQAGLAIVPDAISTVAIF